MNKMTILMIKRIFKFFRLASIIVVNYYDTKGSRRSINRQISYDNKSSLIQKDGIGLRYWSNILV